MIAFLTAFLVITFLIAMNFLYVASEFASVKARKTRLRQMAESGSRMAQTLMSLIGDSKAIDNYVAACQVGITLSSLSLGAYGQRVLAVQLADPIIALAERVGWPVGGAALAEGGALIAATWLVLAFITILQVVVGELIPKSLAIQRPEKWAINTTYLMRISISAYRGLIWVLNGSGNLILRLLGIDHGGGHDHAHSPKEIELLVEESTEAGILDDEERQMLRNTFRLQELTARQVMIHRTKLIAAAVDTPVRELIELLLKHGYTRLPVYKESIDQIAGIAHVKDLFRLHNQGITDPQHIIRDVRFVPETMPIPQVWDTLRKSEQYMVMVFDEYGGTAGIITLEDLIEEIFGELQDEFDNELALATEDQHGRTYLRGDLLVKDVNEYLSLDLPKDVADRISGLMLDATAGSPKEGQEVTIAGTTFKIERIDGLSIAEISLVTPEKADISRIIEWGVVSDD